MGASHKRRESCILVLRPKKRGIPETTGFGRVLMLIYHVLDTTYHTYVLYIYTYIRMPYWDSFVYAVFWAPISYDSRFFFNATTGESSWADPRQLVDFDLRRLGEGLRGHVPSRHRPSPMSAYEPRGAITRRPSGALGGPGLRGFLGGSLCKEPSWNASGLQGI